MEKLKRILVIPVGLVIVLVPFSLLIGWNLVTLLLFWFVITPALAIYLPTLVSGSKSHFLESMAGLIIFYGLMVFMIYDHYKTDYFRVMIFSCLLNLGLIALVTWTRKMITKYEQKI